MPRRDDSVYLLHMRDYARDALEMIQGKRREDIKTDRTLRFALLHVACITGEAASHVSAEGKNKYPDIPWKPLVGMRNRLIHGYDVVDMSVLWGTVSDDFPRLVESLDAVLSRIARP